MDGYSKILTMYDILILLGLTAVFWMLMKEMTAWAHGVGRLQTNSIYS